MVKARRAVLHIGAPKTGTTAIQSFLAKNRGRLRAAGTLYPGALGRPAHQAFAVAMGPLFRTDGLRISSGVAGPLGLMRLRRELAAALTREMAESQPETLLISCENLYSGVRSRGHARRIRNFVARFAEEIEVVVYLRRQDRAIHSAWAHSLRIAKSAAFVAPTEMRRCDRHDYAMRLAVWADVFGRGAVRPIAFDAVEGDVAADFAARVGLGVESDGARRNRSLDTVRAAFMAEINARLPRFSGDRMNPARGDLSRAIDHVPDFGPTPPLAARDASAILALYAASNARLAREWNGGERFFDERIEPEPAADQVFEAADAVRIAAHLWARQQRRIDELEAELADARRRQGAIQPPAQPASVQAKAMRLWPSAARSSASSRSTSTSSTAKRAAPSTGAQGAPATGAASGVPGAWGRP